MRKIHAAYLCIICFMLSGYVFGQKPAKNLAAKDRFTNGDSLFDLGKAEVRADVAIHNAKTYDISDEKKQAKIKEILKTFQAEKQSESSILWSISISPDWAVASASEACAKYSLAASNTNSAVQAAQVSSELSMRLQALQVAQNARIITLLEEIRDKKK